MIKFIYSGFPKKIAKVITEGMPNTPNRGSWPWMAPEVMLGQPYSTSADVYSFGMLIYELITNYPPFIMCLTAKDVISGRAFSISLRLEL